MYASWRYTTGMLLTVLYLALALWGCQGDPASTRLTCTDYPVGAGERSRCE